jgi:hypothetical protein
MKTPWFPCRKVMLTSALLLLGCVMPFANQSLSANIYTPGPIFKALAFHPITVSQENGNVIVNIAQNCGEITIAIIATDENPVYQTLYIANAGTSLSIDASGWESGSYQVLITTASGNILYNAWIDIL